MSTNPLIPPKFRALDSNGNPLSGGKLYSYSAGTSTPLSTYTTRAGSVANANPVILDASGEADVWMSPGVDYKFVLKSSADVTQWTVDNVPSPSVPDTTLGVATNPGGRLTLTTATAVTTSDATGATTVYYTPREHNRIPIWNGTEWALETFSELSQTTTDTTKSPAAVANNSNYDMFVWSDSGTIRLSRGPAWTSDTGRGTGAGTTQITQLNGRYVNAVSITNGPAANRGTYVGTIRSDASAQVNDSLTKRHVWNAYNRVRRSMYRRDGSTTWDYTLNTWRQAAGNASNQLDYVVGLNEEPVQAEVQASAANSSTGVFFQVGIGIDSTTVNSGLSSTMYTTVASTSSPIQARATYRGTPGLGRHYLAWLEVSAATGTTRWTGESGAAQIYSGIQGELLG